MDWASQDLQRYVLPAAISAGATLALGAIAAARPQFGAGVFSRIEKAFSGFSERKSLAIAAVFLFVIGGRLAVLPRLPVPVPGTHDEFSYLLMADTFVHGRLANPPHPMWISFETFHVNWLPTYSSMYPPAQGAVLALGQLLGNPWFGVLLSAAAMCAAILWMLQAWLPARWAFLGGVLAALKFGFASYWINSYWGGAVAAAGGALVLGGLGRLKRQVRVRDALWVALGLAILANSRPYEGLIFSLPSGAFLLHWFLKKSSSRVPRRDRAIRVLLPIAAAMTLTLLFAGFYNWRLTGDALLFPHRLNMNTYHTTGLFVWDKTKPPQSYRNAEFEHFYNGWAREEYERSPASLWRVTETKIVRYGSTFFWFGACFALVGLLRAFRDRRLCLLAITLAAGAFAVFPTIWSNPHYAAPFTCAIFGVLVQAMRHLRVFEFRGAPVGRALTRAIVLLLIFDTAGNIARGACDPLRWPCEGDPSRVYVEKQLEQLPGKHLLLVRYEPNHNVHDEWVYNGADIDGARVVWARELDPAQNAKLFAYFKDRDVWLVEPDIDNTEVRPYPEIVTPRSNHSSESAAQSPDGETEQER